MEKVEQTIVVVVVDVVVVVAVINEIDVDIGDVVSCVGPVVNASVVI